MPGGGLLSLVAYGSQNVLLSGNPDLTYFYTVFKKYTHFSFETTSKLMDGVTDYPYQNTVQLRARVDRVGDLLSDVYFTFQIPAIYSKYHQINLQTGPVAQDEFQWVRYLGAAAIQSVYINIGPNKIQEFTGEYLMARALIDYPKDKFEKWQSLVGDVPELNNPAKGIYGTTTATGSVYPTVYPDNRTTSQVNAPSIPSYTVTVPIPFWFTEEGQALPLIGLQYYPVDIYINLTPSSQLYTTFDICGNRMAPGYQVIPSANPFLVNQPEFIDTNNSSTQIRNFFTDIGYSVPELNTWSCNPQLYTTYVFLPENERLLFAQTPLTYVIRQVTQIPFPFLATNQILDLEVHNPITRLILMPRRSDILRYKNQLDNLTNWWTYPERPKIISQITGGTDFEEQTASGLLVANGQMDILQSLRILIDGNEIQTVKPIDFFTKLTPYKYLSGGVDHHVPVYTFELHSPTPQPAGSLNASRVRTFQLDVQLYPLPVNPSYVYSMNVYVENLNFFIVESGMGDVKYAL